MPIVVMAKAPRPGQAKTRLIPALGPDAAAALARRLLEHAVAQAVAAATGPVELCVTPDTADPAFEALQRRHGLALAVQAEGDLGARMHAVFVRHAAPLLLIGTDAPGLDAARLREAAAALTRHDAVVVPAHDGGYVLIGLRAPCAALFDGMAWSVPSVMAHTRERLRAAGLRHAELAALHDIDEPGDLVHLPPALGAAVPAAAPTARPDTR